MPQSSRQTKSTLFFDYTNKIANELSYLAYDDGQEKDSMVSLPQNQGLIYIENCLTCRIDNAEPEDPACTTCINLLPQESHVFNNTYSRNFEGLIMYPKQILPRASHLQVQGSMNLVYKKNTIIN